MRHRAARRRRARARAAAAARSASTAHGSPAGRAASSWAPTASAASPDAASMRAARQCTAGAVGDALVDRRAHDRVHEGRAPRPRRRPRRRAARAARARRRRARARRARRPRAASAPSPRIAERAGERARGGGHARQPREHDRADALRPERLDARRPRRPSASIVERGHLAQQLAEQQRVALGRGAAGLDELAVRVRAQRAGQQPLDGGAAQRPRAQDLGRRVGDELGQRGPALLGHRPRGDEQQDRRRLDAPGEEAEELQRRLVGPLRVVDAEHERPVVGEVRGQPVEAVQALVGRVVADRRRRGARRLEQRPGQRRGARSASAPAPPAEAWWSSGSKSWRTTPNGNPASSSEPRARSIRRPPSRRERVRPRAAGSSCPARRRPRARPARRRRRAHAPARPARARSSARRSSSSSRAPAASFAAL